MRQNLILDELFAERVQDPLNVEKTTPAESPKARKQKKRFTNISNVI